MHLRGCGEEQVNAVIDGLKQYGFSILIPLHCTGTLATARMRMAFGEAASWRKPEKAFSSRKKRQKTGPEDEKETGPGAQGNMIHIQTEVDA